MTAERGFPVGLSELYMCEMIYCNSTKSIGNARDVTFLEDVDEKIFLDEDRL